MITQEKQESKKEINVSVSLTKSQALSIKRFTGLAHNTSDEVAVKSLIMSVARESINKSY